MFMHTIFAYIDLSGLALPLCGLLFLLFWIWMIVDCIRHESSNSTKITWVIVMVFAGIIGAPIYFFVCRLPRRRVQRFDSVSPLYQPWDKNHKIR